MVQALRSPLVPHSSVVHNCAPQTGRDIRHELSRPCNPLIRLKNVSKSGGRRSHWAMRERGAAFAFQYTLPDRPVAFRGPGLDPL